MRYSSVKKYPTWGLIITFFLFLAGAGLRLYRLEYVPVFGDEAIYIRWAQVMLNEPTLRFLPLSDGKQPLFMWAIMPFLRLIDDPLVAGRVVSVLCGIGTAVGVFILSFLITKSRLASFASTFIYFFSPFGFFFDRLALADSMLSMFGIFSVIFGILLARHARLDLSMILGFILFGALMTKSPALFFSLLLPLALVFSRSNSLSKIHLVKVIFLFGLSYLIAYGSYNFILRLGPNFHMIALRNRDYVFPLSHLWQNPKDPFIFHFHRVMEWYVIYGSWWLVCLFVLGVLKVVKMPGKAGFLLIYLFLPIMAQAMFAKVFTTRYIFFTFPYYAIICGFSFLDLKSRTLGGKVRVLFLAAFLVWAASFFVRFFTDLERAPIARTDRSGFLEEWTSGTGIKEVAKIIKKEASLLPEGRKIVVGTEGYFGTLPDGLQIYLEKTPSVIVIGVGIDLKDIPDSLEDSVKSGNKTYLVINSSRLKMSPDDERLKLVASYQKAERPTFVHEYSLYGRNDTLYLFEIVR